ncbi:MAG: hypothetical protein A2046_02030 [Bacteroidetes bacterium GWA2_30_7]|nr:MAG: hypothetical protein A2046_02030 [Bacteroidetes bacterium GWA2_30_7]
MHCKREQDFERIVNNVGVDNISAILNMMHIEAIYPNEIDGKIIAMKLTGEWLIYANKKLRK